MGKQNIQTNPKVNQIFDDLDKYRQFCVDYGYKCDEASLYDMRNYAYQQFNKFIGHKNFKDQWSEDAKRMNAVQFDD